MRILPSNPVLQRRRGLACVRAAFKLLLLSLALVSTSCARFPAVGGGQNVHLVFTMTVAGHIQDGSENGEAPYIYMVAVNPSTDLFPTVTGPQPVIAPPWGNGFVAGNATHFIQYWLAQAAPYSVYKFTAPDLLQYGITGVPVSTSGPGPNGATIQFEIDISQITPTGVDPTTLQSVQVNFLTMDRAPTGSYSGQKFWDALGNSQDPNSVNDYVRIPLTSSRVYSNADFQDLEPGNDCPNPNLDIVNWSVEVRRP